MNENIFNKIIGKTIKGSWYNSDHDYSDLFIQFTDGSGLTIDTEFNRSDMSFEYIENKNKKKDESDKNMSKELNIIEASNMPVGSKFYFEINNTKVYVYVNNDKRLTYEDDDKPISNYIDIINAKFIPIQKSVTFFEAYNSKKKVKVNHDLIKDSYDPEIITIRDNYNSIDETLYRLIEKFKENNFRDIIDNGKWYIEED